MPKQRVGNTRAKATIWLPKDIWDEVKIRAIREGRNAQDIVADALWEYLRRPSEIIRNVQINVKATTKRERPK
jgi:hypothetical protein